MSRSGIDRFDEDRAMGHRFAAIAFTDSVKRVQTSLGSRAGKRLHVPADQGLLDAMVEAGVAAPFSCRAESCRTCAVKALHGEPQHRDSALLAADREDLRLMCPCVSRAVGERFVLDV